MFLTRDLFAPKGRMLWCGPSLIARVLEVPYEQAEREYRMISPRRYGTWQPVVETFWVDTVAILDKHGKLDAERENKLGVVPLTWDYKRQVFRVVVESLSTGLYIARTSGHVQVVRKVNGRIYIHDNQRDQEWFPGMKGYSKIRCDAVLRIKE